MVRQMDWETAMLAGTRAVIIAATIALSLASGSCSTRPALHSISSTHMADGKEWTTANLRTNIAASYCYGDAEPNCHQYGRLYTWEAARPGVSITWSWVAIAN
jgi:hypothetical protein